MSQNEIRKEAALEEGRWGMRTGSGVDEYQGGEWKDNFGRISRIEG